MFCRNCGSKIFDGSDFCESCGSPIRKTLRANRHVNGTICCPNCRSFDLQATVESTITSSGGVYSGIKGCLGFLLLGPFGLLCGLCGRSLNISTKHASIWLCQNCGNKFRNAKDVMDENKQLFIRYILFSMITLTAAIVTIGIAGSVIAIIFGFSSFVCVVSALVHRYRYKRARFEYESYSKK